MKNVLLRAAVVASLAFGGLMTSTAQAHGPHAGPRVVVYGGFGGYGGGYSAYAVPYYQPIMPYGSWQIGGYGQGYGLFDQGSPGLFGRRPSMYSGDQPYDSMYYQRLYYGLGN